MNRLTAWLVLARDVSAWLLGTGGIIWEETHGTPDLGTLTFFAVLLVAPAVFAGLWTRGSTAVPPSPPPERLPPS